MTSLPRSTVIAKYPDYTIHDNGDIYRNKSNRLITRQTNTNGYIYVKLKDADNEYKKRRLHRVIAMAFVTPEPGADLDTLTVDHIDFDVKNNNASNLRWLDRSINSARKNVGHSRSRLRISVMNQADGLELSFPTRKACASYFGCSTTSVNKFVAGTKQSKIVGWSLLQRQK